MTSDPHAQTRQLNQGFGAALSRAFEIALVPAIFGGIGFLVDRVTGLTPVFTIILTVFALVGIGVRAYYGYEHEMQAHDAALPSKRGGRG